MMLVEDITTFADQWAEASSQSDRNNLLEDFLRSRLISPLFAQQLSLKLKEKANRFLLGSSNEEVFNLVNSLLYFSDLIPTQEKVAAELVKARAITVQSNYLFHKGDYIQAEKTYSEATNLFLKHASLVEAVRCQMRLIKVNCLIGKRAEALALLETTLATAEKLNDQELLADVLSNVASTYIDLDYYEKASAAYRQMLEIAQAINDESSIATAYNGLAETMLFLGDYQQAIELAELGKEICQKNNQTL
jgi:tetratricopeptide (TPR) repeat protein